MRTLTTDEKAMIKHLVDQGVIMLQEIQEMREQQRADVNAVAENLEIKPTLINKAIRAAYKRDMPEVKNAISEVEEILHAAGRKV